MSGWRKSISSAVILIVVAGALIWIRFEPGLPYFASEQRDFNEAFRFLYQLIFNSTLPLHYIHNVPNWVAMIGVGTVWILVLWGLKSIQRRWSRSAITLLWVGLLGGLWVMSLLSPGFAALFHLRHILASTVAIILLAGIAVASLLAQKQRLLRPLGLLILGGLAVVSLQNTARYFPAVKDDYKGMVQTISNLAGNNDVIIYNNGARLLLHEQYHFREDVPFTALPVLPNSADTTTISQLTELAKKHDRIWFVLGTPYDNRDPDKQVEGWLKENARPIKQWEFESVTTYLGLIAYDTSNADCGEQVEVDTAEIVTSPTIWIRASNLNQENRIELRNQQGDAIATLPLSPDNRCALHPLAIPYGTPEGAYTIWDSASGRTLHTIRIAPSTEWDRQYRPMIQHSARTTWANNITLLGDVAPQWQQFAGGHFSGQLYWQNKGDVSLTEPQTVAIQLRSKQGDLLSEQVRTVNPNGQWSADSIIQLPVSFHIDPAWQSGKYELFAQINADANWRPIGDAVIQEWPIITQFPVSMIPNPTQFGENFELAGYELQQDGKGVTIYWKSTAETETNYTVFVHVIDPNTNEVIAQQDRYPADWWRPTSGWRKGEVVTDTYLFEQDLSTYTVYVGLYNAENGQRLAVQQNGVEQPNGQINLKE